MSLHKWGPGGRTIEQAILGCEQRGIDQLGTMACKHHDTVAGVAHLDWDQGKPLY
jgi:hypothetical protein